MLRIINLLQLSEINFVASMTYLEYLFIQVNT